MIRKSLFWGLTLVLLSVLVYLVVRSRHLEKKQTSEVIESVRESKPTATRILAPQDVLLVEAKMKLTTEPGSERPVVTAHHDVVVRNQGQVAYAALQLKFTYTARGKAALESRSVGVSKPLPPGQTISLDDISISGVPPTATACTVRILAADLR